MMFENDEEGPPAYPLPTAECQKCAHEWNPNSEKPKVCPQCKNRRWWMGENSPYPQEDEPPSFNLPTARCKKCGNEWNPMTEQPTVCPECKNPNYWKGPKEF